MVKSQVGATITHRVLTRLFRERGVKVLRTYQLNVGGNSDFKNMLERSRLESKKISKTDAVTSQLEYDIGAENVHIGPQRLRAGGWKTGSGRTSGWKACRLAGSR